MKSGNDDDDDVRDNETSESSKIVTRDPCLDVLRCPRCRCRLVSGPRRGSREKNLERIMPIPTGRSESSSEFEWDTKRTFKGWWKLESTREFCNIGLSKVLSTPSKTLGSIRFVVCVDCGNGPLGYQLGSAMSRDDDKDDDDAVSSSSVVRDERVWLCCELIDSQTEKDADEEDARTGRSEEVPEALKEQVKRMIRKGGGVKEYSVTFQGARLGMVLSDNATSDAVVVSSFTVRDGEIGPAEKDGRICLGDVVVGVNHVRTLGLDYAGVLDLIVGKERPITLHFERSEKNGESSSAVRSRVVHVDWKRGAVDAGDG